MSNSSTPVIYLPNDLSKRCYVSFTYKHKRHRLYNGKLLGLNCHPNRQKTIEARRRELNRLCEAASNALQTGRYADRLLKQASIQEPFVATAYSCIMRQQERFDKQGWSTPYTRDMNRIASELTAYLTATDLAQSPLTAITPKVLARFLDAYRSSGRYYMNKRRNLSALFKLLVLDEDLPANPVKVTPTMKTSETLNEALTPEQLTGVLAHLETHHPNLYLCALMTYGTMLRPHREIRLLQRKDFDATLDCITLAGKATKSGRIRRVAVPDFVKERLLQRGIDKMEPGAYIFTGTATPLNPDYFTTAWSRQKNQMLPLGLIQPNQTLYSFRHSAAHYSFNDRQNLKLLQSLMGHLTPDVTTKYLRSLGVVEVSRDDMPRLPGY